MNTTRTPLFLIANLGSEVSRLLDAKKNGDNHAMNSAYDRSKKILDQIMVSPEMKPRLAEMAILEMILKDTTSLKPEYNVSPLELESYFLPFAHLMMASR